MSDGSTRPSRLLRLANYHLTNEYFIRTHIRTDMIDRSDSLHRQADCRLIPQIANNNLACTQRSYNRCELFAIHERTYTLHL